MSLNEWLFDCEQWDNVTTTLRILARSSWRVTMWMSHLVCECTGVNMPHCSMSLYRIICVNVDVIECCDMGCTVNAIHWMSLHVRMDVRYVKYVRIYGCLWMYGFHEDSTSSMYGVVLIITFFVVTHCQTIDCQPLIYPIKKVSWSRWTVVD